MIFIVIFFVINLALAEFDMNKDDITLFKEFVSRFQKRYETPSQKLTRFALFKKNCANIRKWNAERKNERDAQFGITSRTDKLPMEYGLSRNMNVLASKTKENDVIIDGGAYPPILPESDDIPEFLSYCGDYVVNNTDHPKVNLCLTPYDQGSCGSCYAASTANLGQYLYANLSYYYNVGNQDNIVIKNFTAQRWIDQKNNIYVRRCCGGNTKMMLSSQPTFSTEYEYPYVDIHTSENDINGCRNRGDQNPNVAIHLRTQKITVFGMENTYSHLQKVTIIKKILHHYGPISVSILVDVNQTNNAIKMANYKGGIFKFPNTCNVNKMGIDHQVIIVGYGVEDGEEYLIMRNSWGKWGEYDDGYMKISTETSLCGIGEIVENYYPSNYIIYAGNCILDRNCASCNSKTLVCSECKEGTTMDSRGMCLDNSYPSIPEDAVAPEEPNPDPDRLEDPPAEDSVNGLVIFSIISLIVLLI
ncbi:hypothetical protein ENUP19_0046G0031 [Entamoeba nuttalli]|uniref:Cysteine protease, putative n=2 Tax=Entamoeba nuttalli TaxID=412467 RepID=K2I297_ENTNP|nr:cysteine protease, putative [Entamoeba nuttalli P19]EKE42980.1 cysteine protease, putative [Entamoeba nuttalli P19]|eukprot:XP_008854687.1 cysteine protease, putative [Entamoeba nuttalli P19]